MEMEEYKRDSDLPQYTVKQKLENYWYHYKWHTIVALFLIFAITISVLQFCSKTEYDAYLMYAGPYDATVSETRDIVSSLESVSDDYNGDGEINIGFLNLFMMTSKQIEERNAVGDGYTVNTKLVSDNTGVFHQEIQTGEVVIFLLDPSWFDFLYSETENKNFLMKISDITEETNENFRYYNECGIYLNSTPLSSLPGLCNLPENTILCIRTNGSLSSIFHKKAAEKNHSIHVAFFRKLLEYAP